MQQGLVPCKDDKPKVTEITPFQAGSDYSLSASIPYLKQICKLLLTTLCIWAYNVIG